MVRIRLRRMGGKKHAFYRIVVADQRAARNGRFIENLGHYDPNLNPPEININAEKAQDWIRKGAQPSETVMSLLKKQGIAE